MIFKTPAFWYRHAPAPAPLAEYACTPLAWLYGLGHTLNQSFKTPYASSIPVICIGNAVAGGGGKTPAALAVMKLIQNWKLFKNPGFLSRGYGGTLHGPALVKGDMQAAETGDEPLLLARAAPTVISRDRVEGSKFCAAQGFDAIVLDDGMQNRSLRKDITLMVIDGAAGFGNGKTIPAGPLREPLDSAFAKADAFILIGKDERGVLPRLPPGKPLFTAHIKPLLPDEPHISGPFLAFAGLGRPEKFYRMLIALGADIKAWRPFPDHYAYTQDDLAALALEAENLGAALLTTEKDFMRLRHFPAALRVNTIGIEMVFDDETAVLGFLK